MKKNFLIILCLFLFLESNAQKSEDFYSLYTFQGTKDINLDEIWNLNDSLLLVVGHKHRFNFFYVYELKTFQIVFDTSITASEKFDGSLKFAYYVDSINTIFFPKETFVTSYFKIDLRNDIQKMIPCEKTPKGCRPLEKKQYNKIVYSSKYDFMFVLEKRNRRTMLTVSVAKPYFSERKKALDMDAKTLREYLINGGR